MSARTHEKLSAVLVVALLLGSVVAVGGVVFAQTAGNDGADAGTDGVVIAGNNAQQTAFLRVAHTSPDAPPVDVEIANQTVLSDVAYGNVSDYLAVQDGVYTVNISAADSGTDVFNGTVSVQARTVTTLAATGEVSENGTQPFQPIGFADDAWTPAANESALRIAHLSPDAPEVDVTAAGGSVVLAENVSYQDATDYTMVPSGNYSVEIRESTPTNDGPLVAIEDVSLENGTAYTGMAVGYMIPEEAPANTTFDVQVT